MAIKELSIENFTIFSDFKIEFCNGVNLLIGENGVGKTQLLKSLYLSSISQKRHIDENTANGKLIMEVPASIIHSSLSSVYDLEYEYLSEHFASARFSSRHEGLSYPPTVFIPAKEMLSHAKGLLSMKKKYGVNMPFDISLLDIIEKAQAWRLSKTPELARNMAPSLERTMGGVVEMKDDGSFWMKKTSGVEIPFSMEADGLKRLGLIWQLLMNEGITKDSVILWDEPEASINPEITPVLVNTLLELQRNGVQIIAATHNYNFARYFDILRNESDSISYYSLYRSGDGFTGVSQADSFNELHPNPIDIAGERLYCDVIQKSIRELYTP